MTLAPICGEPVEFITFPVIAPESLTGSTACNTAGTAKKHANAATSNPVVLCVLTLTIDASH
jgi:hypothetical protein